MTMTTDGQWHIYQSSLITMTILHLWTTRFIFVCVDSCFVPAQVRVRLGSPAPAAVPLSPLRRQETILCETSSTIVESSNDEHLGPSLGAWMPLGSASSLTGLGPTRIRVCGVDLAVWHKPLPKDAKRGAGAVATEWSALVDACPHRLAPLSQGRVDPTSGCIECPYHGWSFEKDGSLMKIPQLDEGRTLAVATGNNGAATSFPVHAVGDVLFVFLPTEVTGESWPISHLPEQHYSHLHEQMDEGATYYARDLPYSFDFLVENLADPAHIPFAHHSLLEKRDDASPIQMKETVSNFTHFECEYKIKQREGVVSFQRPAFFHYRRTDVANTPNVHFFTSPIDEGRSRIIMKVFGMKLVPKWLLHIAMNQFLNADAWLHDAERSARINSTVAVGATRAGRKITNGLNYIIASKSDLGPTSFRKWWITHGFADAPPNTFGPASASSLPTQALSRAEMIDPWVHHAKHCSSCRRALEQIRGLQKFVMAGATISAVMLQRRPPWSILSFLAGIYSHNFLRKLATSIEGNTNRAEIGDRSVAAIK